MDFINKLKEEALNLENKSSDKYVLHHKLETRTSRGMLSKGWYEDNEGSLLLVKGNGDVGGFEPQSEVLVSNLLDLLNIPHVKYWLEPSCRFPDIKTFNDNEWVSVCETYMSDDVIEVITFCNYVDALSRMNGKRYIKDYWSELLKLDNDLQKEVFLMLHIDAIVGNQDRHLNNWDLIRYSDSIKMAPLFDFGASLLSWENKLYSDYSRGISPDKAKPFRDLHSKQIQLLSKYYSNNLNKPNLFDSWVYLSIETLNTFDDRRRNAVCNYFKNRLEVYGNV